MTLFSSIGLATALFILAVTPGPGVTATVSKAIVAGFKNTIPVIFGILVGELIFLLFAIYGLSVIAEAFNSLFTIIKYMGAGYLIWLGIRLWQSVPTKTDVKEFKHKSGKFNFLSGLSISLGNPKIILFYLGFLPTFVELDKLSSYDIAVVTFIVFLVPGLVLLFYAYTASKVRQLFKNDKLRKNMNRAAGTVMIGTGVLILSKT